MRVGNIRDDSHPLLRLLVAAAWPFVVKKKGHLHEYNRVGLLRGYTVYNPEIVEDVLRDPKTFIKPHLLIDPVVDVLGQSLLTAEGDTWKEMHKLLVDIFTPRMVQENLVPIILQEAREMVDGWITKGQPVDAEKELREMGARIILRAIFGAEFVDKQTKDIVEMINDGMQSQEHIRPFALLSLALRIPSLPNKISEEDAQRIQKIRDIIDPLILARRQMATQPDDIAGRLINATDPDTGRKLTDEEIRNQIIFIIIAGHETTAVAMTFALDELLKNPEALKPIQEQIDAVTEGGNVETGDFPRLSSLRAAFQETLRLHPSGWAIPREATADKEYPDGIRIKKGDIVLCDISKMHRAEEIWPDAMVFKPERFHGDKIPNGYLPFGTGPRVCLGLNIALAEGTLALAEIFNRLTLEPHTVLEGEEYGFTTRPKGTLELAFTERTTAQKTPANAASVLPAPVSAAQCPFHK